ncbi:MAG TPA: hypothetical protein VGG45_12480 [Terracidiphilus sp.]|jgi:hypothetical protein
MPDSSELNTGKKAIARCMRAWNYACKKETARHGSNANDDLINQAANAAYLRAMPVLAGYKNICEFIACINFASTTGIVTPIEAQHYLTNAKIAISVVCQRPASSRVMHPRIPGFGRRFKSPLPAEKMEKPFLPRGGGTTSPRSDYK